MSLAAVADLVKTLRDFALLEWTQQEELRSQLQASFPNADALTANLVQRGWLTPYQAELLSQGRAAELALGPYILLELLGEGGMGQVFKARHIRLGRIDAVKVIRADRLGTPAASQRFGREIAAAGKLSHPNVVHAHDAGEVGGRRYIAMEYLQGEDLGQRVLRAGPLPFADACELIRQAALGLQHAHERGLVHRDVKPSNLFLTPDGIVKVLDLGLARLTHPDDGGSGTLTLSGAVMGTPDFIAPEQARQSHTVDARADLYSLGCTLYFLLAGRPPFPNGPLAAKVAAHLFEEPTPLAQLRPGTPPAVAAVVRKLTAKKPEDRHPTAAAAAAALGRVLAELKGGVEAGTASWVVDADPATAAPRLRKSAPGRLRWLLSAAAAAILLAGVAVLAGVMVLGRREDRTDPVPVSPPAPAEVTLQHFDPQLHLIVHRKGQSDAGAVLGAGPLSLPPGDYELALPPDALPGLTAWPNEISLAPGQHRTVRIAGEPLSPWALVSRPAPIDGVQSWTISTRTGRGEVRGVRYSPNGHWLAVTNEDGVVRVFGASSGHLDQALVGHFGAVHALAWSSDKMHPLLATADNHDVRVWDPETGRLIRTLSMNCAALTWSPDGKALACAAGRDLELWDLETGRPFQTLSGVGGALSAAAWSPDGKIIAAGGTAKIVHLWNASDAKKTADLSCNAAVEALAWSPDSKTLAGGCADGTLYRWPMRWAPQPPPIKTAAAAVRDVAWSPDGKFIAAACEKSKYNAQVFDAADATATPLGERGYDADAASWSLDGETLAVGDFSRAVHFYNPKTGKESRPAWEGHDDIPFHVAFSPDGQTLATDGQSCRVSLLSVQTGARIRSLVPDITTWMNGLAWSSPGDSIASTADGHAILWDLRPGSPTRADFGPNTGHSNLVLSPGGTLLAAAPFDDGIHLFQTNGTGMPVSLTTAKKSAIVLAWAGDFTLAAGTASGETILWERNVNDWQSRELGGGQVRVEALQWSPDRKTLAAAGADGTVCFYDRRSGNRIRSPLHVSTDPVRTLAWDGANNKFVTVSQDGTERFWDAATWQMGRAIHRGPFSGVVFSPDARLNAAGCGAFTARLWETDTGRPLGTVVLLRQGWLVVSEDGCYCTENDKVKYELVVVVQTEAGQQTLALPEFEAKFPWKNAWGNDRKNARLDTRRGVSYPP
ncbi:MAG TPA: protein kinase [Gemmataceae bacterium]|nr:protein kinase [Gemmataceae bacterium]